jgi:hypothetical protein
VCNKQKGHKQKDNTMGLNLGIETLSDVFPYDTNLSLEELFDNVLHYQDEFNNAYNELSEFLIAQHNLSTIRSIIATEGVTPTLRKLIGNDISLEADGAKPDGFWAKVKAYLKRIWDAFIGFVRSFFGMEDKRIADLQTSLNAARNIASMTVQGVLDELEQTAEGKESLYSFFYSNEAAGATKSGSDTIFNGAVLEFLIDPMDVFNPLESAFNKAYENPNYKPGDVDISINRQELEITIKVGDTIRTIQYAKRLTREAAARTNFKTLVKNNLDMFNELQDMVKSLETERKNIWRDIEQLERTGSREDQQMFLRALPLLNKTYKQYKNMLIDVRKSIMILYPITKKAAQKIK